MPGPEVLGFHFRRAQDRPQRELIDLARHAEAVGCTTVWVSEAWGRDAFVLLTRIGDATSQIRLATGIVNAWGRSAGTLAQTAMTLDEACGGRMVLGLGVSGPKVVRDWHGLDWDRPLARLREVTDVVRMAIRRERVDYQGHHLRLADFRLQVEPVRPEIPIYWGVYGPRSIEAAGEVADGWLAGEIPLSAWHEASEPYRRGAERAGRPAPPVSFMLQVTACDSELQLLEARRLLARDVAFRVGGLGPFHRRSLAELGFGDVCERVAERWRAGDRAAATEAVSDQLLAAMGCVGSAADVRAHVEHARRAGIEEPVITVPRGTSTERIAATLSACADVAPVMSSRTEGA